PHDLALPTELPLLTFTDEVATIEEQSEIVQTPITGADLDAQIMPPISRTGAAPAKAPVADLLEENAMELVEADPLTVDAAAADLEEEAATLDESMEAVPNEDYGTQTLSYLQSPEEALASDDDAAPLTRSEGSHPLEWEDLAEAAAARTVEPLQLPTQPKLDGPPEESEGEIDPNFLDRAPTFGVQETPVDAGFSPFPLSPDTLAPDESATEHRAPISEVDKQPLRAPAPAAQESVEHLTEKGLRERPQAPRAVEAKSLVQTLREQLDTTPNDPRLRRRFAEALLDAGEREQGLRELDAAMRAIELEDDLDTARDIANEILRLVPESVRHHQKCVEYAVRAGDRTQLIEAYLALADALFRGGEHSKAHAVYGRVVELEPNERRALHVLDLLAGRAPGDGALTQRLTPQAGHVRHEEPEAGDPSFEEPELEDLDAEVAAAFQSPDESGDHPHAGHGNGMRPGDGFATPAFVPSGDFIDLGAMLRGDQPEKSTRMVVGDAKPTGDEQADFEDMLRRFKQGVAANVDEEDFDSHYDLGVAFKEMGLVDDAIAQFQKALGSETHRSRAYEALGQCFVEKQQHHVAATLLKRAVETTRVDDRVLIGSLYLLGYACEHLQRDREALVYYQRVFAVDVDFRDVATRIRALESQAAS
ncbi:MAG TPA: tetratricopeptide repeat protein, partial [Gemmatimonadaceae bacterium]|nr:tetratricopeptide repeat protein [Gemmatimonadaceae bacterium]